MLQLVERYVKPLNWCDTRTAVLHMHVVDQRILHFIDVTLDWLRVIIQV